MLPIDSAKATLQFFVKFCQSVESLIKSNLKCEAESGIPNSKVRTPANKTWKLVLAQPEPRRTSSPGRLGP
jgi:hypothetical protein